MSFAEHTAAAAKLVTCLTCGLVCRAVPEDATHVQRCPRCASVLSSRKENSIARTWALIIAAIILYIPANTVPIMTATRLGRAQSDTILSGVGYLVHSGQWPLALLIFFASIVVPILKLLILIMLLLSVQYGARWRPLERTKLYRLTERVGRWSMVDIYVVTILVALVQLGALANIEAEAGALYFGAVVVLTMIAANTFDPRLIWDKAPQSVVGKAEDDGKTTN